MSRTIHPISVILVGLWICRYHIHIRRPWGSPYNVSICRSISRNFILKRGWVPVKILIIYFKRSLNLRQVCFSSRIKTFIYLLKRIYNNKHNCRKYCQNCNSSNKLNYRKTTSTIYIGKTFERNCLIIMSPKKKAAIVEPMRKGPNGIVPPKKRIFLHTTSMIETAAPVKKAM